MKSTSILTFAASLLVAGQLFAGTTVVNSGASPTVTTTTDNDWYFTLGVYSWGAGLNGDIGAGGFTAPVDISFSEILDTLDMTAMGLIEFGKGRWFFQFEGLYLQNGARGLSSGPGGIVQVSSKLTARTTRLTPVIGYRIVDNECTKFDILAGGTYYDISNELQIFDRRYLKVKSAEQWMDPMVGFRLNQRLSERWHFQARADVGGFGAASKISWQALGLFGYDITDSTALFAGYRHTAVDFQKGGFLYDVSSSGPILGLTVTW
ncbi:hypothetical protein [Haloferula sp.]|uniref:hypothetical protein n=1 Tax=Haloferula sp. TaxID=2497595 RepID=UPI003C73BBA5